MLFFLIMIIKGERQLGSIQRDDDRRSTWIPTSGAAEAAVIAKRYHGSTTLGAAHNARQSARKSPN